MADRLELGDVVLITLPFHQPRGREQEGRRPVIVIGIPPGDVRYPIILIAPLTTQSGEWVQKNPLLYPQLDAGTGGLPQRSIVLLDQIRAVDVQRINAYLGSLTTEQYQPILDGLRQVIGL